MKEFEFDNNQNMNNAPVSGNDNNNEYTPPADTTENGNETTAQNENAVPVENIEPQENVQAHNTQPRENPMPENPYFRGYAQPRQNTSPYGNYQPLNNQPLNNQPLNNQQPNTQQPNGTQQQAPQYTQPRENPNWREYPYGNQQNPNENRPNPYARNDMNGQNSQTQNNNYQQSYGQNPQNGYGHQYNSPQQNGGQISYTPSYQSSAKKQKAKKPVTRATIAIACCLTLVLSAGAGFGGAMLAGRMMSANNAQNTVSAEKGTLAAGENNDPVVIYKSVDEVATSTGTSSGENLTYSQVAAMVKDSVVEIVTEFNNQSMWYQYVTQGAGSGVIISEDGYIVTNAHVITDESTSAVADNIIVRLTDATEYTAKAVAYDADSDIAILKIEATGLAAAQCGNSDNLAVGEELVVVGNPLGELGGTVTNGIVSATEREIQMGGVTMSLIQTNAAVNPGNSGGGMFNMKGQLVGIVNAKSSGTGIEGLGFAIPINYALEISEQLLEYGYVRGKTMIGVSFQDVSSSNYFYYYNIRAGVYVAELTPGYNDTVLEVGDRVIAVNGKEISSSEDIKAVVTSCSVGDKITFQLYRNDKLMEVEVTCYEKVPDTQTDIQFDSNDSSEAGNSGSAASQPSGSIEEFFFGGR